VTAVPSLRRPDLVPEFAQRLATALDLPFLPVLAKLCETRPQRELANSHYQAQNLSGAFVVRGAPPEGAVLLVDDVVDSRWTLTVATALLREAGSGPVYPFAICSAART
jgi:ATP-dependent DNA helicase RecQ